MIVATAHRIGLALVRGHLRHVLDRGSPDPVTKRNTMPRCALQYGVAAQVGSVVAAALATYYAARNVNEPIDAGSVAERRLGNTASTASTP